MLGDMRLGADMWIEPRWYETLNGYASLYSIAESVMRILGEVPPGGTLVIDSENFNVLLDNVNVIGRHNGDWIWIGRPTIDLTLNSSGTDQYSWEVYYIAQYL